MTTNIHPKLLAAIQERDAARALMKTYQDFIDMWDVLPDQENAVNQKHQREVRSDKQARRRSGNKIVDTQRLAHAIIASANRSLASQNLLDELTAHGLEIGGKSRLSTMSARLSRSELVEFGGREGWRLTALGKQTMPEIDLQNIQKIRVAGPAEDDELKSTELPD